MGKLSESRKRLKSLKHAAVTIEDEDGDVIRRTEARKSSSTISFFLFTSAIEKSVFSKYGPGRDLIIFG